MIECEQRHQIQSMTQKPQNLIIPIEGKQKFCQEFNLFDLSKIQWRMRRNKLDMNKVAQLWEAAKATHCRVVYADLNQRPSMLKEICQPFSLQLRVLDVGNNDIQSIQCMQRACMPNLRKLWLNDNHITEIQGIRKCCFPNMKVLWLSNNHLKQLQNLDVQWPRLKQLYIQQNILTNIQNLMKVEFSQLKWSAIQGNPWEDQQEPLVNASKCQSRLRWKFRNLERVWMPVYFAHQQKRNQVQATNVNNN